MYDTNENMTCSIYVPIEFSDTGSVGNIVASQKLLYLEYLYRLSTIECTVLLAIFLPLQKFCIEI